jgi:hypothetical protein
MAALGTACTAPLPVELRERGTVAVIEDLSVSSGGCPWGTKVFRNVWLSRHFFTLCCRFALLKNMARLGWFLF